MKNLSGMRIAVAGMARSGLAVAHAAKALGAVPTVLDQKPGDDPAIMAAMDELLRQDIDAIPGWHGRLDPTEFDLLVASPGFPRKHPAIRDMVEGGREAISELEFGYRIAKAPVLAVTGTNGKSTTTVMLWALLRGAGVDAALCGNIAGSGYPELTFTEAALSDAAALVTEVSSYQLEFVREFRPRIATIVNVTPDHLDRHPDFEDYFQTKLRQLARMTPSDCVVLNLDEPTLPPERIRGAANGAEIVGFAPSGNREIPPGLGIEPGVTTAEGNHVRLGGQEIRRDGLLVPGDHNVVNAMTAWEMAAAFLGRPTPQQEAGMLQALLEFRGLEHRMELLGERGGVRVYNNSMCTNPAALVSSSRGLSARQHLLLGGKTKNLDFRPVGDYLADSPHKAYLFGPGLGPLNEQLGGAWPEYPSLEGAFAAATRAAKPGEAILLAPGCASAEPYANFRERGEAFRAMAKEWLES